MNNDILAIIPIKNESQKPGDLIVEFSNLYNLMKYILVL